MVSSHVPQLDIPVFAGHGTTAAYAASTRQQALRDATSSTGALLLSACHEAFVTELSTLPPSELELADVDPVDYRAKESLLAVPSKRYLHNPIISGSALFLIQSLRYVAFVEESGVANESLTPFSDVLKLNRDHGLGVLGLSSGIIPACVVATSVTAITFLSRAVEAFRLAFWIGVRTQIYRRTILGTAGAIIDTANPWGLVLGLNKAAAEQAIAAFSDARGHSEDSFSLLSITAVMENSFVTVSGRPDVLSAFSASLPRDTLIYETTLDTLYHSPLHAKVLRDQVCADIQRRNVRFPSFSDIFVPVYGTVTGALLDRNVDSSSLLESIVDMLLIYPVNWDVVVSEFVKSVPADIPVRLINVGPGSGLLRGIEKALPSGRAASLDLTSGHKTQGTAAPKQVPIAIVGMAVNMPGAPDVSKLWEVLEQGINTIAEIPEHRFKVSDYTDAKGDANNARTMKAHTGNFIDGVDEFDHKFFKISPREAKSMDPQQRILLHASYEALENSGYVPNSTPTTSPENFGCYVGVATHDYVENLRNDIDVYYCTGTLASFLSGRVSYAMQLGGPSVVVDTACSASAVAIYQGCRALMNGDCDSALVGGVNIVSSPDAFIGFDRGHFLSPTGQCKAFDVTADGYSRSEGVGMFVIKRLSDAVAENDNILGIIRGIEVNQSGQAHSITHPHAPTQTRLFRQVLERSGLDAGRVSVIEAHGTGTQAGDPTELESIRSVFAVKRTPSNPLHITSIKANIGHLEAASGAAGLAKLILMLKHDTIPRQISLKNLNPRIAPLESDHVVINTQHAPWVRSSKPRLALLNNFGAAGSNAALLLEEHVQKATAPLPDGMSFIFALSAKTSTALEELRLRYVQWLKSPESETVPLAHIAYTSTARRQIYPYRIAITASVKDKLADRLATAPLAQTSGEPGKVVFVFSGQGEAHLGMARSLYDTSPLFKSHIDECQTISVAAGFPGVVPIITASGEGSDLSSADEYEAMQTAFFSVEYALAKLWISWGVRPDAVIGHGLGEYAALVIAGVLKLKDAVTLVSTRVRLTAQKCPPESTGMMSVALPADAVTAAIASNASFSSLAMACYNGPSDSVVSGPLDALKALKQHFDTELRCRSSVLPVPFGYQGASMQPLLDEYAQAADLVLYSAPTIPVVSSFTGSIVWPGDESVFNGKYLAQQASSAVQFNGGVEALAASAEFSNVDAWISIGPQIATLSMIKPHVRKDSLQLVSLRKDSDAWDTLTAALSRLYVSNVAVQWRAVFSHLPSVTCVDLPSYPFEKAKFWVPFQENQAGPSSVVAPSRRSTPAPTKESPMLRTCVQYPSSTNGMVAIFETPIDDLAAAIKGHSVGGMPLCPASVYLEQVFAGIRLAHRRLRVTFDDNHVLLRRLAFSAPLVYNPHVERTVVTRITLLDGHGTFEVRSRAGAAEAVHLRGEYRFRPTAQISAKFARAQRGVTRQAAALTRPTGTGGAPPEVFSTRTAYEVIFPRVVAYAREYHTMQTLTVDADGSKGVAEVRLPHDHDRAPYVVHPVFMDTLLHVAGFVANMQGGVNDAYICSGVGAVKVLPELIDNDATYDVLCRNVWVAEENMVLAEAFAVDRRTQQAVAHLKGMEFRRVRLNSLMKSLAQAVGKSSPTSYPPKAALPAPHPKLARPRPVLPSTKSTSGDVQAEVVKVLSKTCDIPAQNFSADADLASLGVDSLMSIEVFAQLQNAFPHTSLDSTTLSHCQTVADIVKTISSSPSVHHVLPAPVPVAHAVPLVQESTGNVQAEVVRILSETCAIPAESFDKQSDLAALGVDSLMSIEIAAQLQVTFPHAGLDANTLGHCATVTDIVKEIASKTRASSPRTLVAEEHSDSPPSALSLDDNRGVAQVIAGVLGVAEDELADNADFSALGLDSLTSIEALQALKTEFAIDLPGDFFTHYPTPGAVNAYFAALRV